MKKTKIIEKGKQTNGLSYNAVDTTNLKEVDSFVLNGLLNACFRIHRYMFIQQLVPRVSCTIHSQTRFRTLIGELNERNCSLTKSTDRNEIAQLLKDVGIVVMRMDEFKGTTTFY